MVTACNAVIWHGPGHQSKTTCELDYNHSIHQATYGRYNTVARWKGNEVFSGYFDEAPRLESEDEIIFYKEAQDRRNH